MESTATRRKTWPICYYQSAHDTKPVFFLSFLFLPPLHCNNSSRLCGAKRRCAIRQQHFQLVLPEGEKGGTEWLKYAPFRRVEIHKALFCKCRLSLQLIPVLCRNTYHSTTICKYTCTYPRYTMEAFHPKKVKSDEGPPYICIHPQCGACGQLFLPGDHIVARKMRDSARRKATRQKMS